MKLEYDVVIVGGGASGVIAALSAREKNKDISIGILESQERICKKLRMTGGGRCNFTNNSPIEDFFDQVVNNEKFLYSALYCFTNEDMKKKVRSLGLDYMVEKENYNKVYLKCQNSQNLIEAFERELKNIDIDVFYNSKVKDVDFEDEIKIYTDEYEIISKKIIFSTGGVSYSNTGSDGSMLRLLKRKGYDVISQKPALVPLELNEKWIKSIPGLSLSNVDIYISKNKITKSNKVKTSLLKVINGEIIFTHKGIGGPAALKSSSYINRETENYKLILDVLPNYSKDELYQMAKSDSKKSISTNLKGILPSNFLKAIFNEIEKEFNVENNKEKYENIYTEMSCGNISKKEFERFLRYTKAISISIKSLGSIDRATITSGGISVKDINPSTMESNIHKNVYFSGEMIDVDALTGGYNLQIAFSTGYLAGINAADFTN